MWRKRSRSGALLRSGDEAGAHVGAGFELDAVEQSRGATANNGGARQRLSALCGQSVSQSVVRRRCCSSSTRPLRSPSCLDGIV